MPTFNLPAPAPVKGWVGECVFIKGFDKLSPNGFKGFKG